MPNLEIASAILAARRRMIAREIARDKRHLRKFARNPHLSPAMRVHFERLCELADEMREIA